MTEFTAPRIELHPVERYFKMVWTILVHPVKFFKKMPVTGGLGGPLAFALVTHWLGTAIGFLWRISLGRALQTWYDSVARMSHVTGAFDYSTRGAQFLEIKERLLHWIWGAGSIIADPFFTLFSVLFTSALVYVGARIFVEPAREGALRTISFESAVRVVCFGMTPAILAAFPILGGVVAYFYVLILTVIAAREVYRIDSGRALIVALFPKVLFLGILFSGFALLALFIFKMISAVV